MYDVCVSSIINNPSFFTENQISEQNPHDQISTYESVKIFYSFQKT